MSNAVGFLIAAPPRGTPFFDARQNITIPWQAWLDSVANAATSLQGAVTGASGAALQKSDNLSDLASAGTARANLGLGTAATQNSTAFEAAGAADAAAAAAASASDPAGSAAAAKAAAIAASDPVGSANTAKLAAIAASDPLGSAASAQAAAIAASDPAGAAAAAQAASDHAGAAAAVAALAAKLAGGNAFTGLQTFAGLITIASAPPASSTATGAAGSITWDAGYLYVAVAANTWKRVPLATF